MSVYRFVVAGVAAGVAVKEAVGAEAHGEFGLAEHTAEEEVVVVAVATPTQLGERDR